MGKSKRKCAFNDQLKKDYPFLKESMLSVHSVFCTICKLDFSIASGGKSHISSHMNSDRHKKASRIVAKNQNMNYYFEGMSKKAELTAAAEGTFVYHNVQHNCSFRLMDCTSKIMKKIHDPSFSCARTKTAAIVENIFAQLALKDLKNDLEKVSFVSVYCDASNHGHIKLFPILVRYFHQEHGICVKVLEIESLRCETAEFIANYLIDTLKEFNLSLKLFGFCADNTNTNFGGAMRKGTNNVYKKLQSELNTKITGIGCAAHLVNNTINTAADNLPIDIESIIVKIYSYFHIYTVRVETLKDFCNFVDVEYHQVLSYSRTRWLALLPAVNRLIEMFLPLKTYFLSLSNCPLLLKTFFENEYSQVWLCFIQKQASLFYNVVKEVEGQRTTAIEISSSLRTLKQVLKANLDDEFVPSEIIEMLKDLSNRNECLKEMYSFYRRCIEYLEKWMEPFEIFHQFLCLNLKQKVTWKDIQNCMNCITEMRPDINIDDTELHEEFTYVKDYLSEETISRWNDEDISTDMRWCQTFSHLKINYLPYKCMLKLIEAALCLPGSNAPTERIFSIINNVWTDEKTSFSLSTLKAVIRVKVNLEYSCVEFHKKLLNSKDILKCIHSSEKYKF